MEWAFGISAVISLLGIFFLVVGLTGAKRAKKYFNIVKGMSYEQIVKILGEPTDIGGGAFGQSFCIWKTVVNEKKWTVTVLLKKGIAKNISAR
jgi:hypothetical protein